MITAENAEERREPDPNEISGEVLDAAIKVHTALGPGLLESVIIEIKAANALIPIHEAQLLSYLRLSGRKVGPLLNFHVLRMRDGIKRMVNGL